MKRNIILLGILAVVFSVTGCSSANLNSSSANTNDGLLKAIDSANSTNDASESVVESKSIELSKIEEISIDSSVTDVIVFESDKVDKVEIEFKTYKDGPILTLNEGTILEIQAKTKNKNLNFKHSISPTLTIEIPKNYDGNIKIKKDVGDLFLNEINCQNVNIESNVGDIDLENIVANKFKVDGSVGSINGSKIKAEQIEINNSVGDIDIVDIEGNIEGKVKTGDANFEFDNVVGDFDFSTNIGDLTVEFDKIEKVNIIVDGKVSVGDINCVQDFAEITEKSEEIVKGKIGDGKYKFNLKTSTGDINIQ